MEKQKKNNTKTSAPTGTKPYRISGVNRYTYDHTKVKGQDNFGASLAVPGQTETVRQMLIRMKGGESIPIDNRLQWETEDIEIPFPKIDDLTDLDAITEKYDEISKRINKAKEALLKEKEKQEEDYKNYLKEKKGGNTTTTTIENNV